MKNVVITGSARGFGLELAKEFKKYNYNIVLSDLFKEDLISAQKEVEKTKSLSKCIYKECDVTKDKDVKNLIKYVIGEFGSIDIWINNAGINQSNEPIWNLDISEIDNLMAVDLRGTIICCKLVMEEMIKVNSGAIYNVEGYGSNDATKTGLSMYGTCKRAITYFSDALAKECKEKNVNVIVGKLSPGIMITDFITNANRNEKIELSPKVKRVYNILGDYPDVIAQDLTFKMITNTKRGVRLEWLTKSKAFKRFVGNIFKKRKLF